MGNLAFFVITLRGKRDTCGIALALVMRLGPVWRQFAWQAWHSVTRTVCWHTKHGAYGSRFAMVTCLGFPLAHMDLTLRCRPGTR